MQLAREPRRAEVRALVWSVAIMLVVLILLGWLWARPSAKPAEPVYEASTSVSGYVTTSTGTAVVGAQVVSVDMKPAAFFSRTVLSDTRGHFELHVATADIYRLVVRAPGFRTADLQVTSGQAAQQPQALLIKMESAQAAKEDYTEEVHTEPLPSGHGGDFSEPYALCSDKPRPGYVVKAVSFTLQGDRACDAWSTCKQLSATASRVCWGFQLQGHSECVTPLGKCAAVGRTAGVMRVTYGYDPSVRANDRRVVYVQVNGRAGDSICAVVERAGFSCPEPVAVSFQGPSRLEYSDGDDREAAQALAKKLEPSIGILIPQLRVDVTDLTMGSGQFELWLQRSGVVK